MTLRMLLTQSVFLTAGAMPPDSLPALQRLGLRVHTGFIIPHAPDLKPISQTRPVGVELNYSRLGRSRRAYQTCNCFAQVGAYLNYVSFQNPAVLGQTAGAGVFFEPRLSAPHRRTYLSARATAGVAYLTRYYDPVGNPRNTFFSSPVNALLALGLGVHQPLTNRWELTGSVNYNHISNGGTRQPNRGMNFPTVALGLNYALQPGPLPDPRPWRSGPLTRRWFGRVLGAGSVRVLPRTDPFPEQARPIWSVLALGGYRLNRFNSVSAGGEYLNDGFIRGQIERDGLALNHRQAAVLVGYERWQGRYVFTIHQGFALLEPGAPYATRYFQRYQLLYTLPGGLTAGVGLKATANVAEGFDARLGWQF